MGTTLKDKNIFRNSANIVIEEKIATKKESQISSSTQKETESYFITLSKEEILNDRCSKYEFYDLSVR